ncbi:MAG: sterol desaturase family protein [Bacteroidota bacterium]
MWTDALLDFVARYASGGLQSLAVGGAVLLITRRLLRRPLSARRIRVRGHKLDAKQVRHEVKHTLIAGLVSATQVFLLLHLEERGAVRMPEGLGPWGWPGTLATIFGLVLFNDLWFYGCHRLLHTRWLFRKVHSVHHGSIDVNPLTSYSFHIVEVALLTGWLIPVALIVPLPLTALLVMQIIGLVNNMMSHLGFELLPSGWLRWPVLRWSNTATFHSLHHQRFNGNYGLQTRVWDRLFGTEIPGYEEAFADAHASSRELKTSP